MKQKRIGRFTFWCIGFHPETSIGLDEENQDQRELIAGYWNLAWTNEEKRLILEAKKEEESDWDKGTPMRQQAVIANINARLWREWSELNAK